MVCLSTNSMGNGVLRAGNSIATQSASSPPELSPPLFWLFLRTNRLRRTPISPTLLQRLTPCSYPVLTSSIVSRSPRQTDLTVLTIDSRATPITWLSSPVTSPMGPINSVSFLNPDAIAPGKQVYNNYGPKSNEELLLSYGFVLDPNPDDTVILRLAPPPEVAEVVRKAGLDPTARFALRRDGSVPQELLQVMRIMLGGGDSAAETNGHGDGHGHVHGEKCSHDHDGDDEDLDEEDEEEEMHLAHEKEMAELELESEVLEQLGAMLDAKLDKLDIDVDADEFGVREDVQAMIEVYRKGTSLCQEGEEGKR